VAPLPELSTNTDLTYRPIAGFWRRVLAITVDFLIIGGIEYLVIVTFGGVLIGLHPMWTRRMGLAIITAYFTILNSHIGAGQTIGKRLLNTRVVGEDGNTISPLKSAVRALIYVLPAVLTTFSAYIVIPNTEIVVQYFSFSGKVISSFTILVFLFNTQARQTVHDILCKTYVVEAWTSGRVTADKTEPAMLVKCGLAALLVVTTTWAVMLYKPHQALQSDSVDTYIEVLYSLWSIPDVTYVRMSFPSPEQLTYTISYIGKQTPQEVAEQVAALLTPNTLGDSVTIITTRYLDLVGVRYEEISEFHLQQGRPLEFMRLSKGLSLNPGVF
jgi:uncharacterized RDD family membrane protein YckC